MQEIQIAFIALWYPKISKIQEKQTETEKLSVFQKTDQKTQKGKIERGYPGTLSLFSSSSNLS